MKSSLLSLIIYLCLLQATSCNNIENNEKTNFDINQKYVVDNIKPILDVHNKCYDRIMILPGSGCSGCITKAETFLRNHLHDSKYLFVLTKVQSLKILNHKLGVSVQNFDNVYIDYENLFENYEYSIYPAYLSLDCKTKNRYKCYISEARFYLNDCYLVFFY